MLALTFPSIDPVLIEIGPIAIRWYALAYIAGIIGGWRYAHWVIRRPGWRVTGETIDDFLFYVTLGIVLGGRLGFVVFYNLPYYLEHPLEIFAIWQGGMSFHGGLIGVVIACLVTAHRHRISPFEIGDAAAIATPIGLFFGRIANFINGELYGRITDVPWAMVFPMGGPLPRHPSQLYEAFLEGIVLFFIMFTIARRPHPPESAGYAAGVFMIGYGVARFLVEYVRAQDPAWGPYPLGLTIGQWLCVPMILVGVLFIQMARRRMHAAGLART